MTWEVGKTYPMRGGGEFHVLDIDGPGERPIFGRARYPTGSDPTQWFGASRHCDGRAESDEDDAAADLMPPTPPVVVSDAVSNAFIAAHGPSFCRGAITAAITEWLTEPEQAHVLRAWQEGPK